MPNDHDYELPASEQVLRRGTPMDGNSLPCGEPSRARETAARAAAAEREAEAPAARDARGGDGAGDSIRRRRRAARP
jgi:hypothetical protein